MDNKGLFDRLSRSKIKADSYISPREVKVESSKEVIPPISNTSEIGYTKPMFKNIVFSAFGISINEIKSFTNRDCSLFVIFSGGEQREKDYFSPILKYPNCFPKVKIRFVTGTDQLQQLYSEALKIKTDLGGLNSELGDRVYIITDVDSFTKDIKEILPLCKAENIGLVISNPCFEIWLCYAYFSDKPHEFSPSCDIKKSHEFKMYLATAIKGGVAPTKAIYKIIDNIKNSKANYSETDSMPDYLSTQMHLLAEELLPFIKDGLQQLEIHFKEKENKYKKF
ncbi:MAG: RloB family protein [Rikenellaceae bacterium]